MADKENASSCKRKRAAKITTGQYQIYIEELRNNEPLRTNKFNPKNPDVLDETWNVLAVKLNAAGGPIKTVQQWKERFADWKCNVRKKARNLELSRVKTGGGPPDILLSDIENQLLDLTGRAVVKGIEEISELGLEDDPPATPVIPQTGGATPTPQPVVPSVKLPRENHTPRLRRQRQRKVTLAASVKALVANDFTSANHLHEINESLKALVKLKQKELLIAELKLKLKYPETEFQFLDDSEV